MSKYKIMFFIKNDCNCCEEYYVKEVVDLMDDYHFTKRESIMNVII